MAGYHLTRGTLFIADTPAGPWREVGKIKPFNLEIMADGAGVPNSGGGIVPVVIRDLALLRRLMVGATPAIPGKPGPAGSLRMRVPGGVGVPDMFVMWPIDPKALDPGGGPAADKPKGPPRSGKEAA